MRLSAVILIIAAALSAQAGAADKTGIRDFDLKTIEALGRQLYKQDQFAWHGSDALLDKFPEAGKFISGGWITMPGEKTSKLYFLGEGEKGVTLSYVATFPAEGGAPTVEDVRGQPVPDDVLVRYHARKTAIAAVLKLLPATRKYNFEVLSDPTRKGFIVYALASTEDDNEIVVGRHFRISVSGDGSNVTDLDPLSNSELVIKKHPSDLPEGASPAAYTVSHLVSLTPVETHVFLSLQNDLSFYVGTSDKNIWKVDHGAITKMDAKKIEATEK